MKKKVIVTLVSDDSKIDLFNDESGKLLFYDEQTSFLVAEGSHFDFWDNQPQTVIDEPHPDLLPAFFNLLKKPNGQPNFLITSASLVSLMEFYQNLIANFEFQSVEIVKRESDQKYIGLLVEGKNGYFLPQDIQCQSLEENSTISYKL